MYKALKEIEALLMSGNWTEREARIYTLACRALNIEDEKKQAQNDNETLLPKM